MTYPSNLVSMHPDFSYMQYYEVHEAFTAFGRQSENNIKLFLVLFAGWFTKLTLGEKGLANPKYLYDTSIHVLKHLSELANTSLCYLHMLFMC